jgi:HAMP domain-containing protein
MNNWLIDYHHALQLRLLGLLIIFGIVFPALCLLVATGRTLAKRLARAAEYAAHPPQGHLR